jgi:energy-coupling factor transporter ATP-binding protein EcfA2
MALIELAQVTYSYPHTTRPALRDLSLEVEPGEFVAVIGANGAGKSTLCYTLTGFVPHFFQGTLTGQAMVAGLDTQSRGLDELTQVAGLVFQNPANQISGAKFTVYEELAFGLENMGVPRAEMRRRVDEIMALFEITELADRSPYALSGGQQQRVALAAILVMAPQVLVLDEPTSQLDPIGSREVFAAIRRLSERGMTVIMAEHKLEWVAAFASRVLLLAEGELVLDGPPAEVLASPLLIEVGLGGTVYTAAAREGRGRGLWPGAAPLPVTLEQAEAGFRILLADEPSPSEERHAD